ncbi:hypothetical protein ABKV19_006183, partial [Rosa sericea]
PCTTQISLGHKHTQQAKNSNLLKPLRRTQPKAWVFGKDLNSIKMHHLTMRKLKWVPRASIGLITDATYSCDCQSVYATFEDGNVSI